MADVTHLFRSGGWNNIDIMAESVPHVLHWDLAYLWVLETKPNLRPLGWDRQLRAWKHLVSLFLLGELSVTRREPEVPFADVLAKAGVRSLAFLHTRDGDPIGVLSPIVLARPLPDLGRGDLGHKPISAWPALPPDPTALSHFVALTIQTLERRRGADVQDPEYVRLRLARVLREEFPEAKATVGYEATLCQIDFVRRLAWTDPAEMLQVPIPTRSPTDGIRRPIWVPRCGTCGQLLTGDSSVPPVEPLNDEVLLTCRRDSCPETSVSLEQLMIWRRSKDEVVLWEDRGRVRAGGSGREEVYPGRVHVDGRMVTFEWNAGDVGATEQRFLRLNFRSGRVRVVSSADVIYPTLLVLGEEQDFRGLPVRLDWRDAIENRIHPVWLSPNEVQYSLKLRGWPFEFALVKHSIEKRPHLALAVFPHFMGPRWRHYRVFATGQGVEETTVRTFRSAAAPRTMAWCAQHEDVWPSAASVTLGLDEAVGVTIDVPAVEGGRRIEPDLRLLLSVDFGTTSSLVYRQIEGEARIPDARQDAIGGREINGCARVIAGPPNALDSDTSCRFLPPPVTAADDHDPYLIPSAFWAGAEVSPIRWLSVPPFGAAQPVGAFKWDDRISRQEQRMRYLKELLFLTLPAAMGSATSPLTIAWGYPLAFGEHRFNQMTHLWQNEVGSYLRDQLGIDDVRWECLDESRANVLAFGEHRHGEYFLIADMGGSTLDLALITFEEGREVRYHQVGSLEFAGERFVRAIITRAGGNPEDEQDYWKYRDAIDGSTSASPVRGERAVFLFNQFTALAFEFLRAMIFALSERHSTVTLVLVGNGWRAVEAVHGDALSVGEARVYTEYFAYVLNKLGGRLKTIDPTPVGWKLKHLVAQGLLTHAKTAGMHKQPGTQPSKLPAGFGLAFQYRGNVQRITWRDLVGTGCPLDWDETAVQNSDIQIDLEDRAPETPGWTDHIGHLFGSPDRLRPVESQLRASLKSTISGTPLKITRGPLQLALETQWAKLLSQQP